MPRIVCAGPELMAHVGWTLSMISVSIASQWSCPFQLLAVSGTPCNANAGSNADGRLVVTWWQTGAGFGAVAAGLPAPSVLPVVHSPLSQGRILRNHRPHASMASLCDLGHACYPRGLSLPRGTCT